MPFRLDDFKAKIQFVAPSNFPVLINRAARTIGVPSQTRYIQLAVCEKLSRDLDIDLDALIASLPPSKGHAAVLFGGDRKAIRSTASRIGN